MWRAAGEINGQFVADDSDRRDNRDLLQCGIRHIGVVIEIAGRGVAAIRQRGDPRAHDAFGFIEPILRRSGNRFAPEFPQQFAVARGADVRRRDLRFEVADGLIGHRRVVADRLPYGFVTFTRDVAFDGLEPQPVRAHVDALDTTGFIGTEIAMVRRDHGKADEFVVKEHRCADPDIGTP